MRASINLFTGMSESTSTYPAFGNRPDVIAVLYNIMTSEFRYIDSNIATHQSIRTVCLKTSSSKVTIPEENYFSESHYDNNPYDWNERKFEGSESSKIYPSSPLMEGNKDWGAWYKDDIWPLEIEKSSVVMIPT